jgi:hypothetical protein
LRLDGIWATLRSKNAENCPRQSNAPDGAGDSLIGRLRHAGGRSHRCR